MFYYLRARFLDSNNGGTHIKTSAGVWVQIISRLRENPEKVCGDSERGRCDGEQHFFFTHLSSPRSWEGPGTHKWVIGALPSRAAGDR